MVLHDCRLLSGRSSLCIVLTFSSNVLGLRFASEDGDPFCNLQDLVVSIYVIADSLKPCIAMDFIVRVLRETSDCEVEHAFEKVASFQCPEDWEPCLLLVVDSEVSMAMISIAILVFLAE